MNRRTARAPRCIIIAGPNGAGKTTFAREFLPREAGVIHFVNADLIASDLVYPHVRGETSSVEYKPGHRWFYFSEMQPDEAALIRVHDSANDGRARLSFHTSFDNPLTPNAPPRESIEVRSLVFFPEA